MKYFNQSYPYVFSDKADPTKLYEVIVKHKELPEDLKLTIQGEWENFKQVYDGLTRQMMDGVDEWYEQSMKVSGYSPGDSDHIRDWRRERWTRSEKFVAKLKSMLPLDMLAIVESEFRTYMCTVESVRNRELNPNRANP